MEKKETIRKGPARMQKGREKTTLGELCSRRYRRGGKQRRKPAKAAIGEGRDKAGEPAEERSRPEKAAKTKIEEESSFLWGFNERGDSFEPHLFLFP